MTDCIDAERRTLLRKLAIGLSLAPLAVFDAPGARAAELPLLSEQDPAAKAEHYVEDASRAKEATSGALCSNCSVYGGADGAAQGTCTLFPGKLVKAAGWCKSWSGL
jgi:High potential iron-sulfur protein